MITNYHTLAALVREWTPDLTGCVIGDAFSQSRDELTLAFARPDHEWMLRASVQMPLHYVFRTEGYSKARRNVATLFEPAFGCTVTGLRLAERDRLLYMDLDGGLCIQLMLFGPRANIFLTDAAGTVLEAFQSDADWSGRPAPAPQPAPIVDTFEAFEARWRTDRKHTEQALTAALPLFDRLLAAEVLHRAGVTAERPGACTATERRALFDAAEALRTELRQPAPRIYWRGRFAEAFSLVELRHLSTLEAEPFDSVDDAVRVFVRRTLAQRQFRAQYEPLEAALEAAVANDRARTERMLEELSHGSRADRYEHWGHLLMASQALVPPGAEKVTLPDLFAADETHVTIPLEPSLSAVENAQRYYDRARRTRRAREEAEARLVETERRAREAERLLERLRQIDALPGLETFRKAEAAALAPFAGKAQENEDHVPFRRFALPQGYEVWVGRNAKQNDLLTFRYAQKHDLWMHARGVPGSHAVLRLPHRQAVPGRPLLEQAAAIAAYYSKAQGSSLVPVIVAPRKYVRKPRGAAPGAVVVEREEVLLVEPRLPG